MLPLTNQNINNQNVCLSVYSFIMAKLKDTEFSQSVIHLFRQIVRNKDTRLESC